MTTRTSYTPDGNVASITAVNPTTGDQVTSYTYGATLADSDIATSNLKQYETYPDSVGGSDRVAFTYNRQRQVTSLTDQNGTIHTFDFDKLGRATQHRITTQGSGVDGAVRRLATRYEVRGMRSKLSSYVCRLRDNSVYEIAEERPLSDADRRVHVLRNQIVRIGLSAKAASRPDHPVRLVIVKVTPHESRGKYRGGSSGVDSDGFLRIMTNLLDVPAEIIALIYESAAAD